MTKFKILRFLLSAFLLFLLSHLGHADKIKLKDGRVVVGIITSVDINQVRIETEEGVITIQNADIESLFKEEKTVRIFLKNGNEVEGRVLTEDKDSIRIAYSNVEWQIKREDIQKIEILLTKTVPLQIPRYFVETERKYAKGVHIRSGKNMMEEENYDDGFIFFGGLSYSIVKNIALEFNVGTFRNSIEKSFETFRKGKIIFVPFQLSLILRVPIRRIMPYISFGGDYYINKYVMDEKTLDTWALQGFEIEEKIGNMFGLHAGAGFDFFLGKNLTINIDVKYNSAKTSGEWRMKDELTGLIISGDMEDIRLDFLTILAGFKFYF